MFAAFKASNDRLRDSGARYANGNEPKRIVQEIQEMPRHRSVVGLGVKQLKTDPPPLGRLSSGI